ncbi:MAG: DUF1491 family protein [Pseudomonadota bacterium]
MTPRVTTKFWIDAYRKRLDLIGIMAFVAAKGDETAGAVLIKLNLLNGQARLFQRSYDADFNRIWTEMEAGAEADIDAVVARARSHDPDLWVIEVEDRAGRHLLDEEGLSG